MKERTQKSNTFFGGAAILAVSIAIVKIIGALYKIPLGRILGDVGFGHFNNAYAIYNLLLMISTGRACRCHVQDHLRGQRPGPAEP